VVGILESSKCWLLVIVVCCYCSFIIATLNVITITWASIYRMVEIGGELNYPEAHKKNTANHTT
jgi:hypothetical protein